MKNIFLAIILFAAQTFAQPITISIPDSVMKDAIYLDSIETIPTSRIVEGKAKIADAEHIINDFNYTLSEKECKEAISLIEKGIEFGEEDAYVLFLKGRCEMDIKNYPQAVVDFTKALELQNSEYSFFVREKMYKKTSKGYVQLPRSIVVSSRIYDCFVYRGEGKRVLGDDWGAISDFNKAFELTDEHNAYLYFVRGLAKANIKEYAGAIADLTQAIKLNIVFKGEAYFTRGNCNYNSGLKESACRDWSKAGEQGEVKAYEQIQEYCKK